MSVVTLQDVSKSFGATPVLRRFSARLEPGIHLLVGPNGSGKSTLLNCIAGVLAPDAGTIEIDGERGEAAKARTFLAPPDAPALPWLTGRQLVDFGAQLFATWRGPRALQPLAERLGFARFLDHPLGEMSSGTARKALLAAAWISGAPVLLLDEPTNELDAAAVESFIDLLAEERARTVIIATHRVGSFERLAPTLIAMSLPSPIPLS